MKDAFVETLGRDTRAYMTRVVLGDFRIHVFHRGDLDFDLHDHPTGFLSFPLGSYVEECLNRNGERVTRLVRAFRFHWRSQTFAHRVLGHWNGQFVNGVPQVDDKQFATIVWWGKKKREWGFHTPQGWVPWKQYCGES